MTATLTLEEQAFNFMDHGLYDKAENCFTFLTVSDPASVSGWIGLGMAQCLQKKDESALNAFHIAHRLDPEWVMPLIWEVQIRMLQGKLPEAQDLLKIAMTKECRTSSDAEHLHELHHILTGGPDENTNRLSNTP